MRRAWGAALAAVVALGVAVPAHGAAPRVTLEAARARVDFGESVSLSGRISSGKQGALVEIVDRRGRARARARTVANGRYSVTLRPRHNAWLQARWKDRLSDPVAVRVRPLLRTSLRRVRLFGRARITGRIRPAHSGRRIRVRLYRNGKRLWTRRVPIERGRFTTRFRVRRPGSYRAGAGLDDRDHLGARDTSTARNPKMPGLDAGSRGTVVRLLERRLRELHYRLPGVDRRYDFRTVDAVRAFHKVQGDPRVGVVSEATWRALVEPRRPRPRARGPAFHIEIDQTRQVLYTVRNGKIAAILHTSTGRDGVTHDGVFHVWRKIAGYSPGRLYYPSYFDGLRAIHGWPSVPTSAASHGCARVPMWAAKWIFRKAKLGTEVRIYHS